MIGKVSRAEGPGVLEIKMAQPSLPTDVGDRPYILAFMGENANGILSWWTKRILSAFEKYGFSYRLIDMTDAAWQTELADCLVVSKPVFCFSFQGFGMDLRLNDTNYWSSNQITFLSYLGDSPYHAPSLHAAQGQGLQLLYSCSDFLHTYRAMDGLLYAAILNYGYPENPHSDSIAWTQRSHRIVYVKTGVSSNRMRAQWAELPKAIGRLVDECSREVLTGTNATVTEICAAAFAASNMHCGAHRELFLVVCSKVDFYVRAVRAERMVQALSSHDAIIVGDWSHLDHTNARARFCDPVPADTLDALYADSQVVINTSPSVRRGMHERIMAGLFAKAGVVSDTTPFLRELLEPCPSFKGIQIDDPTFSSQLDEVLVDTLSDPDMPVKVEQSARFARETFGLDKFALALMEQVRLEAYRRSIEGWWSFPTGSQTSHLKSDPAAA